MLAGNIVKTYKQYLALILVPYLFLIVIFHTQLTVYDGPGKLEDKDRDGVNALFAAGGLKFILVTQRSVPITLKASLVTQPMPITSNSLPTNLVDAKWFRQFTFLKVGK